jgi:hypothetical protein
MKFFRSKRSHLVSASLACAIFSLCFGATIPIFIKEQRKRAETSVPEYQLDVWKSIDKTGRLFDEPVTDIPAWKNWTVSFDHFGDETRTRPELGGAVETDYLSCGAAPPYLVKKGERKGYVNESGALVIEPIYMDAQRFRNGLEAVSLDYKTWQMIDKSGAVKFSLPSGQQPYDGRVSARGNVLVSKREQRSMNSKSSLYNLRTGKLLPYSYSAESDEFQPVDTFSEGLARKFLNGHWCYLNAAGKVVLDLPSKYCFALNFHHGLAAVAVGDQSLKPAQYEPQTGAKLGFIDKTGKLVIPAKFSVDFWSTFINHEPFLHDELAAVAEGEGVHRLYGFIDTSGNWVIKPTYKKALDFKKNRAIVCIGEVGFCHQDWFEHGVYIHRCDLFKAFVRQYGIFELTRSQVRQHLGEPDGNKTAVWLASQYPDAEEAADSDCYELHRGRCGNAYQGVQIAYFNNHVARYRYLYFRSVGKWITTPPAEPATSTERF